MILKLDIFKERSKQPEFIDDFQFCESSLKQNLNEMDLCTHWFGAKWVLVSAFNKIYRHYLPNFQMYLTFPQELVIADLGCGSGDLLTTIDSWARKHHLSVSLLGIDANSYIIAHAKTKTLAYKNIHYQVLDIFSNEFASIKCDIVTLNSVCHHFSDNELTQLFKKLIQQTQYAIIINDLHRHFLSYYGIKLLSKILNFSYLSRHDGPISVLRAFKRNDLIRLLKQADVKSYQISRKWLFRWELIIWCDGRASNPGIAMT